MTIDNFRKVFLAFLHRAPFKPFTVELKTGVRLEIDAPDAAIVREGVAIYFAPGGFVPIYFDNDSVTQIMDAPAHAAP